MQGNYTEVNSINFTGKSVHYGKNINMSIIPMKSGGIIFKRIDSDSDNEIPALYSNVVASSLNTTITNGNVSVSTIEHLMAALFACNIKHAMILIDGDEVPLMDGGSADFLFGLESITFPKQVSKGFYLQHEVRVELGDSYVIAKPSKQLIIDCTIDFPVPFIGKQQFIFNENKNSFKEEIAHSKTFGHITQIEKMQEQGLCLGGDIRSAVIFDDQKIISPSFVYNKDDFVKHKILDFIGDISLAPDDIKAEFECYKPSHKLNNLLISKIFATNHTVN